jgi:hypothetical protein
MSDRFFFFFFFFKRHSTSGEHLACSQTPRLELNDKGGQDIILGSLGIAQVVLRTSTVSELLIMTGTMCSKLALDLDLRGR